MWGSRSLYLNPFRWAAEWPICCCRTCRADVTRPCGVNFLTSIYQVCAKVDSGVIRTRSVGLSDTTALRLLITNLHKPFFFFSLSLSRPSINCSRGLQSYEMTDNRILTVTQHATVACPQFCMHDKDEIIKEAVLNRVFICLVYR